MMSRRALRAILVGALVQMAVWPASFHQAAAEAPPLKGTFADNFSLSDPPIPAPTVAFERLSGGQATIEDYRGSVVVLNFWATWCAPCIREMPSLDRLQAALGNEGLRVVASSFDRGARQVVAPFVEKLALQNLEIVLDPKGKAAREFEVGGLPTTYVIDKQGRIVGSLQGPAEWDSPDALELLRYYLQQPAQSMLDSARISAQAAPGA